MDLMSGSIALHEKSAGAQLGMVMDLVLSVLF